MYLQECIRIYLILFQIIRWISRENNLQIIYFELLFDNITYACIFCVLTVVSSFKYISLKNVYSKGLKNLATLKTASMRNSCDDIFKRA
jgi:hypothetical protein